MSKLPLLFYIFCYLYSQRRRYHKSCVEHVPHLLRPRTEETKAQKDRIYKPPLILNILRQHED